jgi:phospholipid N-methyltransferase
MSTLSYVKNFISDKYIASITPTSDFGVRKVCSKIDFSRCGLIVEYGPGTGVFTKYLLQKMGPDSLLILIERNANFAGDLRKKAPPSLPCVREENSLPTRPSTSPITT